MPIELKSKERIDKEYLRQDFHQYVRGNGELVMVSDDFEYFYVPSDLDAVRLWNEYTMNH